MQRYLVGLVVCLGLAGYTSYKLHKMTRITGEQDAVSRRVTDKRVERNRRRESCYFYVPERIQADCDYFETVHVGDMIEVVTVDGEQYVKGGDVYTSKGNFVVDIVLLIAEILGVIGFSIALIRRARSRRPSPS